MPNRGQRAATRVGPVGADGAAFRPVRDTATPARHMTPPTKVSQPGTSESNNHDITIAIAGTTYVVAPILVAVVRAGAQAT